LGSLANLQKLYLYSNQLSGNIPSELGNLSYLYHLYLSNNQLSGSIPPELGSLGNLQTLYLYSNQLSGSIPSELTSLINLASAWAIPPGIRFEYNALYTNDETVRDFINSKQGGGDFEATQTTPPENCLWNFAKANDGQISWDLIPYTGDDGGYQVWVAMNASLEPKLYIDITGTKSDDTYTLDCLGPGTTYYFAINTVTHPHANNQNTVESDFDLDEVIEVTTPGVQGDLDDSGVLDAGDAVALANFLAGNTDGLTFCRIAGDLTGDFQVYAVDLVELMKMLINP